MRKLLLILALLVPALAWAGTCGNGYSFSRQLVLQRAHGSDLTNYPMLIDGAFASSALQTALKTAANGGQVQNTANNSISVSGPADVVFCDAASSGNLLKFEFETYSASVAGGWKAWVEIPTLHTASTDSIYVFVNNVAVVTSQQDLSMWTDISAELICHFPDGSSLNITCSKQKAALTNASVTATTGKIDGAASFSSANLNTGDHYSESGDFSVQAWVNKTACGANFQPIAVNYDGTNGWWFYMCDNSGPRLAFRSPAGEKVSPCCGLPTGTWINVAGTYATSGTVGKIYSNAQDVTTPNASGGPATSTVNLKIGNTAGSGAFTAFAGSIDELRIFSVTLSPDWLMTDYITQSSWTGSPDYYFPAYVTIESSYSGPVIRQVEGCSSDILSRTCPMPDYRVGSTILVAESTTDSANCSSDVPTASGLTFTLRSSGFYTGTIHSYQPCIYTAPVPSSGNYLITLPNQGGPNVAAVVYELVNVDTSGIVSANSGNTAAPPAAMSATSPAANSFLVCTTWSDVNSTSEGYSAYLSPINVGDHGSRVYSPYSIVASGSKSCTLAGGNSGAMVIMGPAAPSTAVRHRVSNF